MGLKSSNKVLLNFKGYSDQTIDPYFKRYDVANKLLTTLTIRVWAVVTLNFL